MRFGAATPQVGVSWQDLKDTWIALDRDSGFDDLWLCDHLQIVEDGVVRDVLEGWTTLGSLAAATSRVRLGLLVTCASFRSPFLLAKIAATVDEISGGRLIVGLGAGWDEREHTLAGVPFGRRGERIARLERTVDELLEAWSSPEWRPRLRQRPHPPILIGGGGRPRVLELTARRANAANVMGTPQGVGRKWQILDQQCAAVGRPPGEVRRTAQVLLSSGGNRQATVSLLARRRATSTAEAEGFVCPADPTAMRDWLAAYSAVGTEEIIVTSFPDLDLRALQRFSEVVHA